MVRFDRHAIHDRAHPKLLLSAGNPKGVREVELSHLVAAEELGHPAPVGTAAAPEVSREPRAGGAARNSKSDFKAEAPRNRVGLARWGISGRSSNRTSDVHRIRAMNVFRTRGRRALARLNLDGCREHGARSVGAQRDRRRPEHLDRDIAPTPAGYARGSIRTLGSAAVRGDYLRRE